MSAVGPPTGPPAETAGSPGPERRLTIRRHDRVRKRRDFEAVYERRTSKRYGPLQVHGGVNDVGHARLGLAVPRRVGSAPRRNRIRRRIREAFRLVRAELPAIDLVVHVRPHDPLLPLDELAGILRRAGANLAGRLDTRE